MAPIAPPGESRQSNAPIFKGQAMDPVDYFLYEELLDCGLEYQCQQCGTRFGHESVAWNETAQCRVAVCPGCGRQSVLGDGLGKQEK